MYVPAAFRVEHFPALAALIRAHPLATLITVDPAGICTSQVPMLLSHDAEGVPILRGHIARANGQSHHDSTPAVALFRGEAHYISPSWYASKAEDARVVPTYDYVAVEARGQLRTFHDAERLRSLLQDLTTAEETRVGSNWRMEDAPDTYIDGMLHAIVGIELRPDTWVGAFKLSQNQTAPDFQSVLTGLRALGTPQASSIANVIESARP